DTEADRMRAELLRLQAQYADVGCTEEEKYQLNRQAMKGRKRKLKLIGTLAGLVKEGTPLLSFGAALPVFLLARHLPPGNAPSIAGARWPGRLGEHSYRYPTTFRVHERNGARFKGSQYEDFESYFGEPVFVTFWFEGVVVAGEHIFFASTRVDGP